jgi:hypothetical protein
VLIRAMRAAEARKKRQLYPEQQVQQQQQPRPSGAAGGGGGLPRMNSFASDATTAQLRMGRFAGGARRQSTEQWRQTSTPPSYIVGQAPA